MGALCTEIINVSDQTHRISPQDLVLPVKSTHMCWGAERESIVDFEMTGHVINWKFNGYSLKYHWFGLHWFLTLSLSIFSLEHFYTSKEIWALMLSENWCFQTVVLKKTLENPLDGKEIQSVNLKGNQPWIFIRKTDAEAETPIL